MSFLIVETASLADALNHAIKIAPERGDGFEKFQGVLIEQINNEELLVSAMDADSTWQRRVPFVEANGRIDWRVPSLVAKFMMQLPMSDGEVTEIEEGEHGRLKFAARATRGEFATLDATSFPRVRVDPQETVTVTDLSGKMKQVAFAVGDTKGSVLTGIHLDGAQLIACDQHRAARVPCEVPLSKPITAVLATLSGALKRSDELQLAAIGNRLVLLPDEDTVITTATLEGAYPDTTRLWAMTDPCDQVVEFDAAEALSVLARILVLCPAEKLPTCTVTFTKEAMVFDMEVSKVGRVTDEAPCIATIDDDFTIKFSPRDLRDVFTATSGTVTWHYRRDAMKAVRVDGYGGFSAVFMPKNK